MARVLGDKDASSALEILKKAQEFLEARATERARAWYLTGSLVVTKSALLIAATLWVSRDYVTAVIGQGAFEVILGSLFGALGAFISIVERSGGIGIDPTAGPFIHYLESGSRIIVGMAGGFLLALAIKANLVLGVTNSINNSHAFYLLVSTSAGASERLVPSLIKKVENWGSTVPKKPKDRD